MSKTDLVEEQTIPAEAIPEIALAYQKKRREIELSSENSEISNQLIECLGDELFLRVSMELSRTMAASTSVLLRGLFRDALRDNGIWSPYQ